MNNKEITELLYKEKNYSKIKELLKDCSESWSFNILAKISLCENQLNNAYFYFDKAENIIGCAYCRFLMGEIEEAKILLTLIKDSSPFSNWLLCLIDLLNENKSNYPTYFQIRNFYEQDLEKLFANGQYDTINKLIKLNSFFETFNREIYKYSARVLSNNNHHKEAKQLLEISLKICFKDPETHFMFGEIYERENNKEEAKKSYQRAIDVNNGYMPASIRLKDLTN